MENDTHTQARPARRLPNRGRAGNWGDGAGHSGGLLGRCNGGHGDRVAGDLASLVPVPLDIEAPALGRDFAIGFGFHPYCQLRRRRGAADKLADAAGGNTDAGRKSGLASAGVLEVLGEWVHGEY